MRYPIDVLEQLVAACEREFCSAVTANEADDSIVALPKSEITFGMIRRARGAIASLKSPPTPFEPRENIPSLEDLHALNLRLPQEETDPRDKVIEAAREVIYHLGPCVEFDEEGYCQDHFEQKPCIVNDLRLALKALDARDDLEANDAR